MQTILIIGSNDNASATAIRLFRSGFPVAILSAENPFDLHHFRNYSITPLIGSKTINGVKALTYADFIYNHKQSEQIDLNQFVDFSIKNRRIPVLLNTDLPKVTSGLFKYVVVCDVELYKNSNTYKEAGATIICCVKNCPGIVDYSVFTNGDYAGQVRYPFLEYHDDTKKNDDLHVQLSETEGVFVSEKSPGEFVKTGERIASINNQAVPAEKEGYISGIIRDGIIIPAEAEIVAISRTTIPKDIKMLPRSAFAVSGGVLEAVMYHEKL